jgi:integrase
VKGHIRERGPGTWAVVIQVGRYPNGRPRYRWYTVKGGKRDAQRELNRLLAEMQAGSHVEPTRLTLAQYLEQWLRDYAKATVSARTYERYEEIVTKHLTPALGKHLLARLTPLQVQGYYTQALASGRRDGKGGLSKQTVLHHHRLLHTALAQAVRWQLVARNVAEAVEPPRPDELETAVVDVEAAGRLLEIASGGRLYLPVLLTLMTGMRLGEVLGLRWEDVDLKNGVLRVRQALEQTRAGLAFKAPKTHRSKRPVALPSLLVDALVWHRGEQERVRTLLGSAWQEYGLVCSREDGAPWPPKLLSKAFEHLASRAGMPEVRFHDLRHSHASQLLQQGIPLKVVSERLGHARASTTLDIYSHLLPGMQEEAARRVDELFGGELPAPDRPDEEGPAPA